MARGFFIAFAVFLHLGVVAGVGYQVGATVATTAGATAAAAGAPYFWNTFAFGSFPFFGFLLPFLFIFMIFAMAASAFRGARGHAYGRGWGGPRMFEEWHREAHERGAGKGES